MSVLFRLSRDFIDKLSNPSHGSLVNEEYSLKLAQVMEEEGFKNQFARDLEQLTDPDTLSSYGWTWLLRWCRINEIPPHYKLLTSLMHRWSDVFIQSLIIDTATFRDEKKDSSEWLDNIIRDVTSTPEHDKSGQESRTLLRSKKESSELDSPAFRTQPAENLLLALLHLETGIAINGAKQLLRTEWRGQRALLNYFRVRVDLLDEDTRKRWISMLEPPGRYE